MLRQLSFDEFVNCFDESLLGRITELAEDKGTTYLVLFENQQMDSSWFGARSCVPIGPHRTYETLESIEGGHLYDLPSQRQYPQAYVDVAKWRESCQP